MASAPQQHGPHPPPLTTFFQSVAVPPLAVVACAAISESIVNALLNYLLARPSEVPLLKRSSALPPLRMTMHSDGPAGPTAGPASDVAAFAHLSERSPLLECPGQSFDHTLEATLQYSRHAKANQLSRRHMQQEREQHGDQADTDSMVTGDMLHYPSSPMPTYADDSPNSTQLMELNAFSLPQTGQPPTRSPLPQIFVTPTSSQAQALYAPAGSDAAVVRPAADDAAAEVAAATALLQARLQEVRVEAQYIVFDTNRMFLLSSVVKCLCFLVVLHYHLDLPGGMRRFTIATGMGIMYGLLSPILELAAATLLPNDVEVQVAATARRSSEREAEEDKEQADSVLVVELVLRYCTYDFKDLTTVFIQGSVFILIGTVLVPPMIWYCSVTLLGYLWLFGAPALLLYYARRLYYAKRPLVKQDNQDAAARRSIRSQGAIEILKCLALKTSMIFLMLWTLQSSFILAMLWHEESHAYVGALERLWSIHTRSAWDYMTQMMGTGEPFSRLSLVSQILF